MAILAYVITFPRAHRHANFTVPRESTSMLTPATDDCLVLISDDFAH